MDEELSIQNKKVSIFLSVLSYHFCINNFCVSVNDILYSTFSFSVDIRCHLNLNDSGVNLLRLFGC